MEGISIGAATQGFLYVVFVAGGSGAQPKMWRPASAVCSPALAHAVDVQLSKPQL